jgi:AcrR family transcriptional regulator
MSSKKDEKRAMILSKAKQVFIRKGFAAVTMKDIIEACAISRGGLYLYFKSVDELFMQVIMAHNAAKLKEVRDYIAEDKPFRELVDAYFEKQKKRILNINGSLLVAMYEYRFAHKHDYDRAFFFNQFMNTKEIVLELLQNGVVKGELNRNDMDDMAMHIVFFIEGISMLGTAAGVSEAFIDRQIGFIKSVIFSEGEKPL